MGDQSAITDRIFQLIVTMDEHSVIGRMYEFLRHPDPATWIAFREQVMMVHDASKKLLQLIESVNPDPLAKVKEYLMAETPDLRMALQNAQTILSQDPDNQEVKVYVANLVVELAKGVFQMEGADWSVIVGFLIRATDLLGHEDPQIKFVWQQMLEQDRRNRSNQSTWVTPIKPI